MFALLRNGRDEVQFICHVFAKCQFRNKLDSGTSTYDKLPQSRGQTTLTLPSKMPSYPSTFEKQFTMRITHPTLVDNEVECTNDFFHRH